MKSKYSLLLIALLWCVQSAAQTVLSPMPHQCFNDVLSQGKALSGGKLYTYQSGTSIQQATFTDSTGLTPNSNPIILDAAGCASIWLTSGQAYSFVATNANGAQEWTSDNVSGLATTSSAFAQASTSLSFSSTPTFSATGQYQVFKMTLTGNVTSSSLAMAGVTVPSLLTFEITQDGTGGRTFTWPLNVSGASPISSGANSVSAETFFWDGTTAWATNYPQNFQSSQFGTMNGIYNVGTCATTTPASWCSGTDLGAWINAAIAACGGTCDVYIPAGIWTIVTTVNVNNIGISIHGAGARATHIFYGGTGDAMKIQPIPFTTLDSGTFSGFTLEATGTGTSGIHVINTNFARFYDLSFVNFSSGAGVWLDNQSSLWSERNSFVNCYFHHNLKGVRFSQTSGTSSFARTHFQSDVMTINPGQTGISLEGGANLYDSFVEISGNLDGSGASTSTLFTMDGSSAVGGNTWFDINFECQNAVGNCVGMNMASGAALFGRGSITLRAVGSTISNSIVAGAHFFLAGSKDPLQPEFSQGIGPWLIPQTINGEDGLGLNARWDGSNWLCNGDGGNNGCALVGTNIATGQVDFYIGSRTSGANQSISDATFSAGLSTSITSSGVGTKALACQNVAKSANYTLSGSDCIVQATVAGGSFTITLPHAISSRLWEITRTESSANVLTIAGDTGNVNNLASIKVPPNGTAVCHSDGTNSWCTVSPSPNACLQQSARLTGSATTFTYTQPYSAAPACVCSGEGGSCNISSVSTTACVLNVTVAVNHVIVCGTP